MGPIIAGLGFGLLAFSVGGGGYATFLASMTVTDANIYPLCTHIRHDRENVIPAAICLKRKSDHVIRGGSCLPLR